MKILLPLLASCLVLSGCARMELAYRFADRYVASKLDDWFDLDGAQEEKARAWLKAEKERFLRDGLPRYFDHLEEWIRLLEKKELSRKELDAHSERGRAELLHFIRGLEPGLKELLLGLRPEQFKHFGKEMGELLREQEEDASGDRRNRFSKKRMEAWLSLNGLELSETQMKLVDDYVLATSPSIDAEMKSQRELLRRFLESSAVPERLRLFVEQGFARPEELRTPEYARAFNENLAKLQALHYALLKSLDAKQVARAVEANRKWIEELKALREKKLP